MRKVLELDRFQHFVAVHMTSLNKDNFQEAGIFVQADFAYSFAFCAANKISVLSFSNASETVC